MEEIVYRPFGFYRFLGLLLVGIAVFISLLSVYFILPGLLMLIPVFSLFRVSKVTVIASETGIRILHEKTCPDRYVPWDQLKSYQLNNSPRGQDVILLSSVPLPPMLAKKYAARVYLPPKLWFDGILVIPLNSTQKSDSLRKFIYQMVVCR